MPLVYDDVPGSWGVHSRGWPTLHSRDKAGADRAYVACSKEHVIPYGSYVLVDTDLRVETREMLSKLKKHLKSSKLKTYHDVMYKYEESYRKSYDHIMKMRDGFLKGYYLKLHFPHLS